MVAQRASLVRKCTDSAIWEQLTAWADESYQITVENKFEFISGA